MAQHITYQRWASLSPSSHPQPLTVYRSVERGVPLLQLVPLSLSPVRLPLQ